MLDDWCAWRSGSECWFRIAVTNWTAHFSFRTRHSAFALALTFALPLTAQQRPELTISLPASAAFTVEGPVVRARGMLGGARLREPLAAGFPARFHFTVELWSEGRWLNDLERRVEYDVIARYIALERVYEVMQVVNDRPFPLGKFARVDDAERAIGRQYRVPITAPRSARRMYYQVTLVVQILQLSDLEELDRWLRGELRPAISGERNAGTVLTRGLRAFAARLVGGETREYEDKTPTFRVP